MAPPARKTMPRHQAHNFSGLSVLLADDEEITCLLAEAILTQVGFTVTLVNNGQKAVAAAGNHHFDVILLDIHMPVMDGLECCRALRDSDTTTPIIAITAASNGIFRKQCLDQGFTDFIGKPFKSSDLLATIRRHLSAPSGV